MEIPSAQSMKDRSRQGFEEATDKLTTKVVACITSTKDNSMHVSHNGYATNVVEQVALELRVKGYHVEVMFNDGYKTDDMYYIKW